MFSTLVEMYRNQRAIYKEAKKKVEENKKLARRKKKLYDIALAFNDMHTHTGDDLWMCPTCNKVHATDWEANREYGWLIGRHYPACCNIEAGHRHFNDIQATTGNTDKFK